MVYTAAYYPLNSESDPNKPNIRICLKQSGNPANSDYTSTIKHEIFHAVQFKLLRNQGIYFSSDFARENRLWIFEGTANAAVNSIVSQMNVRIRPVNDLPRTVIKSFLDSSSTIAYQVQDFWVYLGRSQNRGISYLKQIFTRSLSDPIFDIDSLILNDLGYEGGLSRAYWKWVREQIFEKQYSLRNSPSCKIDFASAVPDSSPAGTFPQHTVIPGSGAGPRGFSEIPALETRVWRFKDIPGSSISFDKFTPPGPNPQPFPSSVKFIAYKDGASGCTSAPDSDSPQRVIVTGLNPNDTVYLVISNTSIDPTSNSVNPLFMVTVLP